MRDIKLLTIFILILSSISGISQNPFPTNGVPFNDTNVPRVDITINPDSLDQILAPGNEASNHEFPADFIFTDNNITDTVTNVGFRLRGNTSRNAAKKSFKVSFNTFEDKEFHGLEKINLNGEHNDPTIIRSKVCWDICYDFGVIGSRSNHVELYINGEYKGLYINVEHIDEEFVNLRFGNKDGNLYKCLWPANMDYLGSDPNLYKDDSYGRRMYDLKTNTIADDYSDLANLIDVLNNTPINNLREELEPIFNVTGYLKYLAVEIFTGHWDAYSYNKNNYYLYNNPETGLFEFIPYDLDNTLGIDWIGRDWGIRDINDWASHSDPRPLTNRLLEIPEYKARFNFLFNKLIDDVVNQNTLFPKISVIKANIEGYVVDDTYHSMDYGWSYQDFQNSYANALGGHVAYGLSEYLITRINSAEGQLILTNISPIISETTVNSPGINQLVNFNCKIEDENIISESYLIYSHNGSAWDTIQMFDDGQHLDGNIEDDIFGTQVGPLGVSGQLSYYFEATDLDGITSRYPYSGQLNTIIYETSGVTISINELMASNDFTISDESGSFDDWLEIYNYGSTSVFLGDKYLTDDYGAPMKWQLPNVSLNPQEYIIIWADAQELEGDNHTNFKLSASGEELIIFDSDGISLIDNVTFGPQATDISYGRIPNGIGPLQFLQQPTPGYSNELVEIFEIENLELSISPNPFSSYCEIRLPDESSSYYIEVFNIYGMNVLSTIASGSHFIWDGYGNNSESLSKGAYIFRIRESNTPSNKAFTSKVIFLGK